MLSRLRATAKLQPSLHKLVEQPGHRSFSLSGTSSGLREEEKYVAAITDRFHASPESAAKLLADSLTSQHRALLLQALGNEAQRVPRAYADKLFREADTDAPLQQLDKEEFIKALQLDRQLTATAKAGSTESPSFSMCTSVALAAALPFVGFGFLDNFIMVCSISAMQHSRLQQLTTKARICHASVSTTFSAELISKASTTLFCSWRF
ncbi:TPA: hypothetical protein ACH3X1_002276 [Trebouxia sp. C0004]